MCVGARKKRKRWKRTTSCNSERKTHVVLKDSGRSMKVKVDPQLSVYVSDCPNRT